MVAALELYFDEVAERRIRVLWNALEAAGVPTLRDLAHRRHRPHLQLCRMDFVGLESHNPVIHLDNLKLLLVLAMAIPSRLSFTMGIKIVSSSGSVASFLLKS